MALEYKGFDAKAEAEGDKGIVHAMVSVFGVKDKDDDIVQPGAFGGSIKSWSDRGKLPPGIYYHDMKRPVALTLEAKEDTKGLHVVGQFNLETQDGKETFSNIKAGIISEYSFGYVVTDKEYKSGVRHIKSLNWYEWSPVVFGAMNLTKTEQVKEMNLERLMEAKAEILGSYVEGAMTMSAMRCLNDALHYNVLWEVAYDAETPLSERLELMSKAIDEYKTIALRTLGALLQGSASEAKAEINLLRELWQDPKGEAKFSLPGGLTFEQETKAALGVVEAAVKRAKEIKELRAEKGQDLSAERQADLAQIEEKLQEQMTMIKELMAEAASKSGSAADVQQAYLKFLAVQSETAGLVH